MRIVGGQSPVSTFEQGILCRRQTDFVFEAETKLYFEPTYFQHLAGLTYRYSETTQYNLCVTYDEELGKVIQFQSFMLGDYREGQKIAVPKDGPLWLKVSANYDTAVFSYSLDGKAWRKIRPLLDVNKLTDEYGGTLGVLSMEDVLEQIVGDIWDDNDEVEPEAVKRTEGEYELDGAMMLYEMEELLGLPEDSIEAESNTVGGWTIECFGGFPQVGDSFEKQGLKVTVLEMSDGRRVDKVLVKREDETEKDE